MTTVQHPPSAPDFEDDMPSGITHLPPQSQPWAWGVHRAVRDIRDDVRDAKRILKLLPVVTAGMAGVVVGAIHAFEYLWRHFHP